MSTPLKFKIQSEKCKMENDNLKLKNFYFSNFNF